MSSIHNNYFSKVPASYTKKCSIEDKAAIKEKNGACLQCIGRQKDDLSEGYIYEFTKPLGTGITQSNFPAVEYLDERLESILSNDSDYWKALGYEIIRKDELVILRLPDVEALSTRYEKLRFDRKNLPEISIKSASGKADDENFIEWMINHDLLISNSDEFIHDHTAHAVSVLELIRKNPKKYREVKEGLAKHWTDLLNQYRTAKTKLKKEDLDKYLTLIGIVIDASTGNADIMKMNYDELGDKDSSLQIMNTCGRFIFLATQGSNEWCKFLQKTFDSYQKKNKFAIQSDLHRICQEVDRACKSN